MKEIDEIIDEALRLYRDTLPQTALPAALGAGIGGIPIAMVLAEVGQPPRLDAMDWSSFGWAWLFQLLLGLAVQGMLLKILAMRARNGVQLPLGEALAAGVALLYLMATLVLCVLIVPGIWMMIAGMLCAPAIAVEGRDGLAALKRSIALVRGKWWRTFGLLLLAGLCAMLAYLLLAIAVKPLADAAFGGGWPTEAVLTAVVGGLLTPLFNALLLVIHLDYAGTAQGAPPTQRVDQIAA
jgi:hypothetical protein